MSVRNTSKKAYDEEKKSGSINASMMKIKSALEASAKNKAYSLREICGMTGMEINSVSGHVNEMKKVGILVEAEDTKKCPVSGKTVHPVMLAA